VSIFALLLIGATLISSGLGSLGQPVTEAPTARLKSRSQVAGHLSPPGHLGPATHCTSANSVD